MVKRVKPVCSSRTKPGLPGESGWVAAAVGLVCLGGMTKPADAYSSYYGYSDIYSRRQFGDTMLPASHRSRKHTDSDKKSPPGKNEQAAKKEQPKPDPERLRTAGQMRVAPGRRPAGEGASLRLRMIEPAFIGVLAAHYRSERKTRPALASLTRHDGTRERRRH